MISGPRRLRFVVRLVALATTLLAVATAAPLERDLGDGLTYFRLHTLPADLPADAAVQKGACVLDLRYATADAAAANVFGSWLKFHARSRTPLLLLVNGATASSLHAALAGRDQLTGVLTIGIVGQKHEPDVAVSQSTRDEQAAYQALESGSTIAALTTDHPEKQRNDEASLAHDRTSDSTDAAAASDATSKSKTNALDASLQRAIQLYRALRAMKRA